MGRDDYDLDDDDFDAFTDADDFGSFGLDDLVDAAQNGRIFGGGGHGETPQVMPVSIAAAAETGRRRRARRSIPPRGLAPQPSAQRLLHPQLPPQVSHPRPLPAPLPDLTPYAMQRWMEHML